MKKMKGFWFMGLAVAKSLQLCPTLCDPRDGSPPGSSVPGILQARILEWVAISFSQKNALWPLKKKKQKTGNINIVYLSQHIQNIVISACSQYLKKK